MSAEDEGMSTPGQHPLSAEALTAAVRSAWSAVPAPPAEDLKYMAWAYGEDSWRAFVNVDPVDVDIHSSSFLGCTPLLDLPPRAAAAYLGPYLLSLFEGLQFQEKKIVFYDILTRAHVLHVLSEESFWRSVIRAHLPPARLQCVRSCCAFMASESQQLNLSEEQRNQILALARTERH